MSETHKVLVVGCGTMGSSHARAYKKLDGYEIVGLVSRKPATRERLSEELGGLPTFDNFDTALKQTGPDVVSINTYPDTHHPFAMAALSAGAHVFMEKPIAETVAQAEEIARTAKEKDRKVVVGYILRQHPAWIKFIELARTLGKPLVMRMNLNQQSKGETWSTHKQLMNSMAPIVDCGVHYVDVMCQMTQCKPVRVAAIGARLSDELKPGMYNYGQLQVTFEDGSVGWYEAGWGPMMSDVAFFVKDVVGPRGCVSIKAGDGSGSDDIDSHTQTNKLQLHHAAMGADGEFAEPDESIDTSDEPDHDGLCELEQIYLLNAIREGLDTTQHVQDAVNSLAVVLAADESVKSGQTVAL